MKNMIRAMAVVLAMALAATGNDFQPCGAYEAAVVGASHVWTLDYADLTVSTTNTSQSFSNSIPANHMVEFVRMELAQAYSGTTNYTQSCLVQIGDGDVTNRFLSFTELCADGTEVYVAGPKSDTLTCVSTPTLSTAAFDGTNVVTNLTITTTATIDGTYGIKRYTAATNIIAEFSAGNKPDALNDFLKGEVRLYFRLWQPGRL